MEQTQQLYWAVSFGAVAKLKADGKHGIFLSERQENGTWTSFHLIEDSANCYKALGNDQASVAFVCRRGERLSLKDCFTLTLIHNGDSCSVGQAVKNKVFESIVEKGYNDWLKSQGPIKNFFTGDDTILGPDMLLALYDHADFPAFRVAYEASLREAVKDDEAHCTVVLAKFDALLSNVNQAEGDELYWFQTPVATFQKRAGRTGYVILRQGKVVASKIEVMN